MSGLLKIDEFLHQCENGKALLLDVRSEKEYAHAHIPGAINLPILNNDHRHLVGTEYKLNGREAAVILGFKLVGPCFHEFIEKANELTSEKEVYLYCWRGGMRSSIMMWILSMAGFKISVLKGGYKVFRNYILQQFSIPKKVIIVSGHTGSGKTEILNELRKAGEQVLDLEALANHRGSAFGKLGLPPQNTNEFFENEIGMQWRSLNKNRVVWIEGESHSIGQNKIPDGVFNLFQSAPIFEVVCSREFRKRRILEEYGVFSTTELAECTSKLKKRLGGLRLSQALVALEENRMSDWLDVLIDYYDRTYDHSMSMRNADKKVLIEVNDDEKLSTVANRMIEVSNKI